MARITIALLGLLLLHLWAAMAEATYMKYKDPKQPLNTRIQDLLSRMTPEEKIGQMVQIDRSVASAEVMKKYFIGMPLIILFLCLYNDIRLMLINLEMEIFGLCRECIEWWRECSSKTSFC